MYVVTVGRNSLGKRIRQLRNSNGLSLRAVATATGVSAAFMSDVELGRREPSDRVLEATAGAFGIPLSELEAYDNRIPIREFRQATIADPAYAYAWRQILQRGSPSVELLEFVANRDNRLEN